MDNTSHLDNLRARGLASAEAFMATALARNIGLLSRADGQRLARARVAIPGLGGVGGSHLITLTRAGIGRFHLADMDRFEPANFNRQYGARVPTLDRPKADVLKEDALSVNPFLDIRLFSDGLTPANMDEFLDGVDVVLDSLDFFVVDTRRLLFKRARDKGIPVVTAGPLGFGAPVLVFTPDGMSFDDYFDIHDDQSEIDKIIRFYVGITPPLLHLKYGIPHSLRLERKAGPSLGLACQLASAVASTEVLRILLNRPGLRPAPHYLLFDAYCRTHRSGRLRWGNRGPWQRMKLWAAGRGIARQVAAFRPVPPAPEWDRRGPVPDGVKDFLITAGIQAPSGDNLQPWRFKKSPDGVDLVLYPEGDPSFFNFRQSATNISNGMIVENMRTAATQYGLDTRVTLPPENSGDTIARVTFNTADVPLDALAPLVWERDTNRRTYDRKPIPPWSVKALVQAAADRGAQLHLVTERDGLNDMAEACYWADRARVVIPDCHKPLHDAIRSNARQARARGDGFSYNNLMAGIGGRVALTVTRPWPVMKALGKLGLGNAIANISRACVRSSSAMGLITVGTASSRDFFQGGQAWERVWLTATAHGIALQPMASLAFFWNILRAEGEKPFPPEARPHLSRGMDIMRRRFSAVRFDQEGVVILFRLGYALPIPEGTFRRPVASFFF